MHDTGTINICDAVNCDEEIPIGERCYLVIISEINAEGLPHLPEYSELSLGLDVESGDLDDVEGRVYPFRLFCSSECLAAYLQAEN